ncbi:MAG: helix-turn-helix transcriptional regulator [Gemmataceae bacterium]
MTDGIDELLLHSLVGKEIRNARVKRQLTQAALAEAVGLTRVSITNIERGRQRLSILTLFQIAAALGLEPAVLVPRRARVVRASTDAVVPNTVSASVRDAIVSAIGPVNTKKKDKRP